MNKQLYYLLLVFLIFCQDAYAQDPGFNFTHLTIENGLADNYCHAAIMDQQGYIWFATQDGLSRYDGHVFKNYQYNEQDTNSIKGQIFMDLIEDKEGYIWIASNGGGLNRYDPVTEHFNSYDLYLDNNQKMISYAATSVLLDSEENIWMGTYDKGLHLLDKENGHFTRFNLTKGKPTPQESFKFNSVLQILEDIEQKNILWIAANDGLYRFNKDNQQLKKIVLDPIASENVACNSLMMDKPGELWVGTWGAGLIKLDTKTEASTFYYSDENAWKNKNRSQNVIHDVDRKSDTELWISTNSAGLAVFNLEKNIFSFIKSNPSNPFSLKGNHVNGFYTDAANRHWVLNESKGVNILDPANQLFHYISINSDRCFDNTLIEVSGFAFDTIHQILFVTTSGCGGLYTFNRDTSYRANLGQYYPANEFLADAKKENQGYKNVYLDSKQRLWLLPDNEEKPIEVYTSTSTGLKKFDHPLLNDLTLLTARINDVIEDQDQIIWLATGNKGVIKIDFEKGEIAPYHKSNKHPTYIDPSTQISEIKQDSRGIIWLATLNNGVFAFHPKTAEFVHYPPAWGGLYGFRGARVMSIEEDKNGKIWVGLSALGIQIIDPDLPPEQKMASYQTKDGLPDGKIVKIIRDQNNDMWISTNKGLCQYSFKNQRFNTYGTEEGVKDLFLLYKGLEILPSGEIFIGQNQGFQFCDPNNNYKNEIPPKTVFSNFKIFEEEKSFDKNINYLDEIVLKHNENFFTISFAALNYSQPEKNRFSYILEGVDKDWILPQDGRQFANYTNVREGNYLFKVKAANNDGVWSENVAKLSISITPPWHRTWWFSLMMIGLGLFLLYSFFHYRLQRALEIERMRTKISSDLHDDVGTLLSGVAMQADILEELVDTENKPRIARISEQCRIAMSRMRDVVWAFDSRKDKMEDLLDKMKEHAKETIGAKGINYIFDIKNININKPIPLNIRQNIYLIFKEAITNIAKHSNATKTDILLNINGASFEMKISDNGQTDSEDFKTTGMGLSNIKMRADKINANLIVEKHDGFSIYLKMKSFH